MLILGLMLVMPLLFAGIIRVFVDKYRLITIPVDFGMEIGRVRLFGSNKTWGGTIILTLISGFIGVLMYYSLGIQDVIATPWYGFFLGVFYNIGELVNSFIKRRMGVESGKSVLGWQAVLQYILDQSDSILAIMIYAGFGLGLNFWTVISIGSIGLFCHIGIDMLNHLYGSKKTANKSGMYSFYQILGYFLLSPLKILIRSKVYIPIETLNKRGIIMTSNHPSWHDPFVILLSMDFGTFAKFVPFRYIVAHKYLDSNYGIILRITGAISHKWLSLWDKKPIEQAVEDINEGYNFIIFYEGKKTKNKLDDHDLKSGIVKIWRATDNATVLCFQISKSHIIPTVKFKGKLTEEQKNLELKDIKSQINTIIYG